MAEKAAPAPVRQQVALHLGMVWLCFRTGNLYEAQRHADTAARFIETGIAPDDSLRADHRFMEALVLRERREYGAALRNLERCLAIRERVFGPEHASVAWAMQSLGWNELSLERIDSARRYFQRAQEIDEKLLGFHHLWVAFPVDALGVVELQAGNLDAARRHLERALELLTAAVAAGFAVPNCRV